MNPRGPRLSYSARMVLLELTLRAHADHAFLAGNLERARLLHDRADAVEVSAWSGVAEWVEAGQ